MSSLQSWKNRGGMGKVEPHATLHARIARLGGSSQCCHECQTGIYITGKVVD